MMTIALVVSFWGEIRRDVLGFLPVLPITLLGDLFFVCLYRFLGF